jgi:Ca2+/Na+ antiporter
MIQINEYWTRMLFYIGAFISVVVIVVLTRIRIKHLKRKLYIHGILTLYLLMGIVISQGKLGRIAAVCFLSFIVQSIMYYYLKFEHPDSRKENDV